MLEPVLGVQILPGPVALACTVEAKYCNINCLWLTVVSCARLFVAVEAREILFSILLIVFARSSASSLPLPLLF